MKTTVVATGCLIWFLLPAIALSYDRDAPQTSDDLPEQKSQFQWIPGPSREIPNFLSASRDVGAVSIQLSPYLSSKAGGDLALFGVESKGTIVRFGFFGLMEAEGSDPLKPGADGFAGLFPEEAIILWRGQYGCSLSLALTSLAKRWFEEDGAIELTLGLRHESEHFFGQPGEDGSRWRGVKDIGNFILFDTALRIPIRYVDLEIRAQFKGFLPSHGGYSYTVGPGADVVFLWHLHKKALPFFSSFFEYLWGGDRVSYKDNYLARFLLGTVFPGSAADFQLFLSIAMGHGKGLLAFREEFLYGGGFRISWPPEYSARKPRLH